MPNLGLGHEREYDLVGPFPGTPIDPIYIDPNTGGLYDNIAWTNYGIWFDRDGVDPWQAGQRGNVNGQTYETGGIYDVEMQYHANNSIEGAMYAKVNDIETGTFADGWKNAPPEIFPAGMSFTADTTAMQVFAGIQAPASGYGQTAVKNITVTGCLAEGMATGGGWFIPEGDNAIDPANLAGNATFGFVARQKNGIPSGQLEFKYQGDGLDFKSTDYDWVSVSSGTQIVFEGTGRLNGVDGYRFCVWAFDGDKIGTGIDRFEIRIWIGGDSYESPTYRAEGNLGGGQIIIHK